MNVSFYLYVVFTIIALVFISSQCAALMLASSGMVAGRGSISAWSHSLPLLSPLPSHLLQGTLLASCTSSTSPELPSSASLDPKTEEARAHLPVPGNLDGVLSTSWFPGHKAQPETMIFSPEGLPGPGHTGQEMLGTQGSLDITSMIAQDSGSHTAVPGTSRRGGNATERIHVKGERGPTVGGTEFSVSRPANTGRTYQDTDTSCASNQLLPNKPPPNLKSNHFFSSRFCRTLPPVSADVDWAHSCVWSAGERLGPGPGRPLHVWQGPG